MIYTFFFGYFIAAAIVIVIDIIIIVDIVIIINYNIVNFIVLLMSLFIFCAVANVIDITIFIQRQYFIYSNQ